jgi:hypothetical protein
MIRGINCGLSTLIVGALLSACGGGGADQPVPSEKVSNGEVGTPTISVPTILTARQVASFDGDPTGFSPPKAGPIKPSAPVPSPIHGAPAGIRYTVEAPFISEVPLRIVVGDSQYAELCLYNADPQQQRCTTIDSPIPAGMDLEYTDGSTLDPSGDVRFLSFVPVVANTDPEGHGAQRFIEGLSRAASVWGVYLRQHPELVSAATNSFISSGASNLLLVGPMNNRYASLIVSYSSAAGGANYETECDLTPYIDKCRENKPEEEEPPIQRVDVNAPRLPQDPPPIWLPFPEQPPFTPSENGGGAPIGQYPKDSLVAQLTPVAPPCAALGGAKGGILCSITIFGSRPPKLPPVEPLQLDRGRQYFAPQVLCDWNILCNEGQEPRDNNRGPNSGTSGKSQTELDQICTDINITEIRLCNAIIKAKGKKGQELWREIEECKEKANARMFACFETAKRLTNNGAQLAP